MKIELLPQLKRVGDIIRIHRANIGQYRNYKTFMVNMDFGSSWALFRGAEPERPLKSLGDDYADDGLNS